MEREKGHGKIYREKKEYKKLCDRKIKKENERWVKKPKEARRKSEIWEIITMERKERKKMNDGIGIEEWKEYYARILGRVEERVVGRERRLEDEGERKEELGREEMRRAIRNLKDGNNAGMDGITGEVWKYGGEEIERWLWKF